MLPATGMVLVMQGRCRTASLPGLIWPESPLAGGSVVIALEACHLAVTHSKDMDPRAVILPSGISHQPGCFTSDDYLVAFCNEFFWLEAQSLRALVELYEKPGYLGFALVPAGKRHVFRIRFDLERIVLIALEQVRNVTFLEHLVAFHHQPLVFLCIHDCPLRLATAQPAIAEATAANGRCIQPSA